MTQDLKYPIGKFQWEDNLSDTRRTEPIDQIAETSAKVRGGASWSLAHYSS